MKQIKIQTPAKINLTLEILGMRSDGFHNIRSIMHTISLSDFLTISLETSSSLENEIILSGTSEEIPYNEKNIVHKALKKYFDAANIKNKKVSVHIEKNIPVSAGLAGGSTNACGALYGINELLGTLLSREELHNIAAELGSDLNFCLDGGCALCTKRGEVIEKLPSVSFSVSLIKPKSIGISAKEAYQKFALLSDKSYPDNTSKLKAMIENGGFDKKLIYNSLEKSIIPDYYVLKELKENIEESLMSGSGSTFFVLREKLNSKKHFNTDEFEVFENLTSVNFGAKKV